MLVSVYFTMKSFQPLHKDRIPVVIKNTNRPEDKGTYILHDREINSKMSLVVLVVIKTLL